MSRGPSADGTAVITIAHGRHAHLRGQQRGLAASEPGPAAYVVVAMGDPGIEPVVGPAGGASGSGAVVHTVSIPLTTSGELPLAAARNLGAATAIAAGACSLVFLDVDCIPSPGLVGRYRETLLAGPRLLGEGGVPDRRPLLLCGEVGYLPPLEALPDDPAALAGLAEPHPARPVLGPRELRAEPDLRQFWSLSFAMSAVDWQAVGGFCEEFTGYGAEDTDFAQRLGAAGGRLLWVGGAPAYHQHHESPSPPVQHLTAIVRNANLFRRHWGWFPMEGWLAEFETLGLAALDSRRGTWVETRPAARSSAGRTGLP